jgi:hypothetical protein
MPSRGQPSLPPTTSVQGHLARTTMADRLRHRLSATRGEVMPGRSDTTCHLESAHALSDDALCC